MQIRCRGLGLLYSEASHNTYRGSSVSRSSNGVKVTPVASNGTPQSGGTLYRSALSGLVLIKQTGEEGHVSVELTNFPAEIVEDIQKDDGVESCRFYKIRACLEGKRFTFAVPAERFASMTWATEHMGPKAIVYPGRAEHARAAIQALSQKIVERRVFGHIGWLLIGGEYVYLHGGGAIGQNGPVPRVEVDLPDALERFKLPAPPSGEQLKRAIKASLRFLTTGPERITIPLYAAIWRSIIGPADFSLHVDGPTGAGKTVESALAQQHFGAGLDDRHLPVSWSSTGNALEGLAFAAKDALIVVDDFAPGGSQQDVQRYHRDADRLLRAQGNRSGRLRMRADTSLRPMKPPRGLILSTGEDTPRGQSLRARILALTLSPDDLDWDAVTVCQGAAARGLFTEATAGFVQWLARKYPTVRKKWAARVRQKRTLMDAGAHRRTPGVVAELHLGLAYFLAFAQKSGAMTENDAKELCRRARHVLNEVAGTQADHQAESEPTRQFLELLRSAITSGRAHLADPNGEEPTTPAGWGWRNDGKAWRPHGDRIGWLDGDDAFLDAMAAFSVAQRVARDGGDSLPVSLDTLKRRLHEKRLLATTDSRSGRRRLEVRRTLQQQRRSVLHMRATALQASASTSVAQVTPPLGRSREERPGTAGPKGPI